VVQCWGVDDVCQLGDACGSPRGAPVDTIPPIAGALDLAAGSTHTCIVTAAHGVACWGEAFRGQLGDGAFVSGPRGAAMPVMNLTMDVAEIAAGGSHTCARYVNGTVACWGSGASGELGYGGTNDQNVARDVVGITGAREICAGAAHTCAIVGPGGDVMCWGLGDHGAIGDGMSMMRTMPTSSGLDSAVHIACGNQSTCALRTDGSVWCWGLDTNDMMMTGATTTPTDLLVPTRIPMLP
jgi:alpha-tubulin suppressor-like RCC1 family protein